MKKLDAKVLLDLKSTRWIRRSRPTADDAEEEEVPANCWQRWKFTLEARAEKLLRVYRRLLVTAARCFPREKIDTVHVCSAGKSVRLRRTRIKSRVLRF